MSSDSTSNSTISDAESALQAISSLYPTLTEQLRKAADYVVEHPVDVALLSIRKSAAAADVTPSTLTRLAKCLGFDRYDSFRQVFQQAVHSKPAVSFGTRIESIQQNSGDSSGQQFQQYAMSAMADMEKLFNDETLLKLQQVARRIVSARRVFALGFRDTFACAHHFAYVGRIAFPHISLIRGQEGNLLSELAEIGDDDVVVAFGSDPYSIETVKSVEIIHESGAELVAITDDIRSPLASGAAFTFTVDTDTPHFFPSIVASITLVEALLGECVALGDKGMVDNIHRFENNLRRLGGYYRK